MQANDQRDQALENLANGKAPKGKRGGLAPKKQTAEGLSATGEARHQAAGKLGKAQAMQDLTAIGQSYSQTLAAGMNAFNGTAQGVLENLISDEFQIDAAEAGDFDFLGEAMTSAFTLT